MKKIAAFLLALMLLALAGCSGDTKPSSAPDDSGDAPTQASEPAKSNHVVDYKIDVPDGFEPTEMEGLTACWYNADGSNINLNITDKDATADVGFTAITADMIVAFPGETDEEFYESMDFISRCAFSSMHIFPYSKRPGTPAATMAHQVPRAEKEARAHRAAQVMETLRQQYLQSWVGHSLPVLFEEEKAGAWRGHAPNYVEVFAPSPISLHNMEKLVQITALIERGDGLVGMLL